MVNTALGMNDGSVKKIRDYSLFMTAGIMISSMALPIVLARTPIDKPIVSIHIQSILMIRSISLI